MSDVEGRDEYLRANAPAVVAELEAQIVRLRKELAKLNSANHHLRRELALAQAERDRLLDHLALRHGQVVERRLVACPGCYDRLAEPLPYAPGAPSWTCEECGTTVDLKETYP